MHIPDAYIPLSQSAIYWAISIIFIVRAIKWVRNMDENMIPLFGVLAAGMFVLQTINIAANLIIPVPMLGGVSWHIVGAALTAIIFASPWAAVLLLTLVLAIQSLFGDGGITTMGANILNMGIIGGFTGYYCFIGLSKLSTKRSINLFISAMVSMILPSIALAFELWLAGTFPLKQGVLLMSIFQGTAGIGEGIITVIVFNAIVKTRPDIISEERYNVSTSRVAIVGLIIFLGLAIAAPFLASSNPDGLEQTAGMIINNNIGEIGNTIPTLFSDYAIPGLGKAGEVAAIILGLTIILIIWYGISKILKNRLIKNQNNR